MLGQASETVNRNELFAHLKTFNNQDTPKGG